MLLVPRLGRAAASAMRGMTKPILTTFDSFRLAFSNYLDRLCEADKLRWVVVMVFTGKVRIAAGETV